MKAIVLVALLLLVASLPAGGVIVEEIDPCAGETCIRSFYIDHVEPFEAPAAGYKAPGSSPVDIYDR